MPSVLRIANERLNTIMREQSWYLFTLPKQVRRSRVLPRKRRSYIMSYMPITLCIRSDRLVLAAHSNLYYDFLPLQTQKAMDCLDLILRRDLAKLTDSTNLYRICRRTHQKTNSHLLTPDFQRSRPASTYGLNSPRSKQRQNVYASLDSLARGFLENQSTRRLKSYRSPNKVRAAFQAQASQHSKTVFRLVEQRFIRRRRNTRNHLINLIFLPVFYSTCLIASFIDGRLQSSSRAQNPALCIPLGSFLCRAKYRCYRSLSRCFVKSS